jgi:outer membrane protein assembly factor BamB
MKKAIHLIIVLVSLMLLATFSQLVYARYASTEPWPMYRHDLARTGTITSAAPDSNQTLLWSHGRSTTKPHIVVDGMVIIISSTTVYALDETTGVEIWNSISFPNALTTTLTYYDGRIYVGSGGGYMYCLNATTGAKLWEYQTEGSLSIESSPAIYNGKVYFGTNAGYMYSLNATTGLFISRYTAPDDIKTAPTIRGDLLYFGCDDGKLYALNISQTLFSLKWTYTTSSPVHCTPTVDTEKVYFGSQSTDHSVFALNRTTGTLVWKYTLLNSWPIDNPMVVVNGMVYVAPSYGSKIYALYANATPGTYSENAPEIKLWSQTFVGGYYPTSPVVADNKIYVGASYILYALDVTDGTTLWTYDFNPYYPEDPIVADGRLFVHTSPTTFCFGSPFPPVTYYYTVTPLLGYTYTVELTLNATPSNQLNMAGLVTLKKISYSLTGIDGTTGMSNITVPNEMLGGPYTVTVDGGTPIDPPGVITSTNATHTSLYFTYMHSSHLIEIVGTTVVPEYPMTNLLTLLIMTSLLAIALARRKSFKI